MTNNVILFPISLEQLAELISKNVRLEFQKLSKPPQESIEWFDLEELCNYLPDKPAKPTVYGWVHAGLIPCHKGAKKLRFLKSEIDAWLMRGKKMTSAEINEETDAWLTIKKKGGSK